MHLKIWSFVVMEWLALRIADHKVSEFSIPVYLQQRVFFYHQSLSCTHKIEKSLYMLLYIVHWGYENKKTEQISGPLPTLLQNPPPAPHTVKKCSRNLESLVWIPLEGNSACDCMVLNHCTEPFIITLKECWKWLKTSPPSSSSSSEKNGICLFQETVARIWM